eukprot:gi/632953996/ref/XP_007892726.1/ PREDICTED: uncharacterized protein LOC103179319 [Callorhinchus milii]
MGIPIPTPSHCQALGGAVISGSCWSSGWADSDSDRAHTEPGCGPGCGPGAGAVFVPTVKGGDGGSDGSSDGKAPLLGARARAAGGGGVRRRGSGGLHGDRADGCRGSGLNGTMPLAATLGLELQQRLRHLESRLRAKEERIVHLETENALLHLKLAECRGMIKRSREKVTYFHKLQEDSLKSHEKSSCQLPRLFAAVKILKQEIKHLHSLAIDFCNEFQEKCKTVLKEVAAVCTKQDLHTTDVNSKLEILKYFLVLADKYNFNYFLLYHKNLA